MAQEFIKRDLRSPSTADFPMITAEGVSSRPITLDSGGCGFSVRTYVDAQNAFGATIRQRYAVLLAPEKDGSSWRLIGISAD